MQQTNSKEPRKATFCWSPEEQEVCYEDETGWADGLRYTSKGNWATYTPYDGQQKTVTLYAGQTMDAGTVTFSGVNGNVIITIQLSEGWFFDYMDDDGEIEESVHIQGYDSAPSGATRRQASLTTNTRPWARPTKLRYQRPTSTACT